ncbi:putative glycolipid-binding domain-containing protein [Streptosporangium sp. NPDC051022]|uniref:putative glycolipid-binding domain-containing protein n=1 Tax=Streptosporangium sp. NPDC051022 TaxID=3155752 RepID=UPI00344005DF
MRGLVWMKEGGAEYAEVNLGAELTAVGVAIGTDPVPYRLEYTLRTLPGYVTELLSVRVHGAGWHRALDLRRSAHGAWSCETKEEGRLEGPSPGGDMNILNGALDCDLGLSPLTNSMPVLRHGLAVCEGRMDLVTALVRVPHLHVVRHPRRYTHLAAGSVRFESEDLSADLALDEDGIVTDYPGLARLMTGDRPSSPAR